MYDHYFRQCREPITSIGIITFRLRKDGVREYLLVRRKNTLGFIEFVLGHYDSQDPESIIILFKQMVAEEIEFINKSKQDFNLIWDYLWNSNPISYNSKFKKEKEISKTKFEELNNPDNILTLDYCTKFVSPIWDDPEWGFPKGRRNVKETNIKTAIREFEEETSYSITDLVINQNDEITEIFNGTNGILYRHIYYVAECFSDAEPIISKDNKHQMNEIGDIKWLTLEEALSKIRDYHTQKRDVLKIIDENY